MPHPSRPSTSTSGIVSTPETSDSEANIKKTGQRDGRKVEESSPQGSTHATKSTASSENGEKPLAERTVAPRFAPHLSSEEEINLSAQFEEALKRKGINSLVAQCKTDPWLVTKYPEFLELKGSKLSHGFQGNVIIKLCTSPEYAGALAEAVKIKGTQPLLEKDRVTGITALHYLAQQPGQVSKDILGSLSDDALCVKDHRGRTPLHHACERDCFENCQLLLERISHQQFMEAQGIDSPFARLMTSTKLTDDQKCQLLETMMQIEGLQQNLPGFVRKTSLDAGVSQTVKEFMRSFLPTSVTPPLKLAAEPEADHTSQSGTLEALDLALPKQQASETSSGEHSSLEALNLESSVPAGNARLEETARQLARGLGVIGVHARVTCFPQETKDNFYSLGDENASVMLVNRLVELGAPKIQLRLSAPDKFESLEGRVLSDLNPSELSEDQKQKLLDMKEVGRHKLALLLPENCGFDPKQGLPQDITIGKSTVHIVDYDDRPEMEPALEMGFNDPAWSSYQGTDNAPDNYLELKAYRFSSEFQAMFTGMAQGLTDKAPLKLPPNSFPQDRSPKSLARTETLTDETDWITSTIQASKPGPIDTSHAQGLAQICRASRNGDVHSGMIYGLHHPYVSEDAGAIMGSWIKAVKRQDKPSILYVHPSRLSETTKAWLETNKIPVIYPGKDDMDSKLAELAQSKDTVICALPELPKPVFEHLIQSSDLPALVEGANTTSHLLETGHPYLSVLPFGNTPIPKEMGYPLEALKAEAFSYKLRLIPAIVDAEKLTEVKELVGQDKFAEAIDYLQNNQQFLAIMQYLYASEDSVDASGLKQVTVAGLLEKGKHGRLGALEKTALMQVLDPSSDAMADYIEDCLNDTSTTRQHYTLQQSHITQQFNDSVLQALMTFAKKKGIITP
ncbi:ankyrin repeat domain-containing protein [Parendozoicomonas haliclonae]|uniref:Uncharacterized protein n=1 Tax=Parendozoicomonas haliclonae TaxID=1960125 RepID=A0A1X7AKS4_9GAMM|nr:ankyrin repeat domain-containing protein [Parendozoicomonas haliclonae]SMA48321.1 hypothetical protein EHSB41UT_02693 [Parendozoicomonas haliclonae]